MKKQDVIEFFDRMAPRWDADMIRHEDVIAKILDGAGVKPGVKVLDVACGTGVLIPDYLERQVARVTGVDIAPEMIRIASGKFPQEHVSFLCGDVEDMALEDRYDVIMVYNAFPHFPEPERLVRVLSGLLGPGGRLTIAHGMSRAAIDNHHRGTASKVSCGLISEHVLAAMMRKYLTLEVKISDARMYQVTGRKA